MSFVGFVSIMPIMHVLHVCFSIVCIVLREYFEATEWNVGKPNQDSTMGSLDDTHRLSVWWQAYPSKKKQELHLTK